MTKEKFLKGLGARLSRLPKREIEECLAFYGEMIDDRMEEGLSEEEAVSAVGDIKEIAAEKLGEEISENLAKDAKGERAESSRSLSQARRFGFPWLPPLSLS